MFVPFLVPVDKKKKKKKKTEEANKKIAKLRKLPL